MGWLGIIVTVISFAAIAVLLVYERPSRESTHAGRMDALGAAVRFARKENAHRESINETERECQPT